MARNQCGLIGLSLPVDVIRVADRAQFQLHRRDDVGVVGARSDVRRFFRIIRKIE